MILVGIGSNLCSKKYGEPVDNCKEAIEVLKKKMIIDSLSPWYQSEPLPVSNQPWYINGVLKVKTSLNPNNLLNTLLKVENSFGRTREKKNEPRVIDLDLLTYNDLVIDSKLLVMPHPRMHKRRFVLDPLIDIAPEWVHPILKINAIELRKKIKNQQNIKKL